MNEHQFATYFTDFWQSTLPNLESVTRALNLGYERVQKPITPKALSARRDLISESAFRLFGLRLERRFRQAQLPDVQAAYELANTFLVKSIAPRIAALPPLDMDEMREVALIEARISRFVTSSSTLDAVVFEPKFRGHGALDPASGDLVVSDRIIEIKCVDRPYRSTDLRQLLIYCALQFFSKGWSFEFMELYNPLKGTSSANRVDDIVLSASGRTKEEFFYALSDALSVAVASP